jgi:CRP-like cAMP-binding protein
MKPKPVENNSLGFYLIRKGCLLLKNTDDGYEAKELVPGDYFGESDLLRCVGYEFFG